MQHMSWPYLQIGGTRHAAVQAFNDHIKKYCSIAGQKGISAGAPQQRAVSPRVGDCAWLFHSESKLPTLECLPTCACNRLSHLLELQSEGKMTQNVQYAVGRVTKRNARKLEMQRDDQLKLSKLERVSWCNAKRATFGHSTLGRKGSAHLLVVTKSEPFFCSILNPRNPGICCMNSSLSCHAASNSSSFSSGTMNLSTHSSSKLPYRAT